MKLTLFFSLMLFAVACTGKLSETDETTNRDTFIPVKFTESELLQFMDSIHNQSADEWIKTSTALPDSVYESTCNVSEIFSATLFEQLKKETTKGKLSVQLLHQLPTACSAMFPDSVNEPISAVLHFFSAQKFEYFAIELFPDTWESTVLFMHKNKCLAIHRIFHKYGLELNYFENENGMPTIYYRQNFESGTGIWWWNYYFFAYTEQKLVPVLNELQNANFQFPWGLRSFWFETTVLETKPLSLKMVYNAELWNLENDAEPWQLLADSCVVIYRWNKNKLSYEPDFSNTKLTRTKITSFYLTSSELLFINAYYDELKQPITGTDSLKKRAVFNYLNEVKNSLRKKI